MMDSSGGLKCPEKNCLGKTTVLIGAVIYFASEKVLRNGTALKR